MKTLKLVVFILSASIFSCGKDSSNDPAVVASSALSSGEYFLESETSNTATGYLTKIEGKNITFLKITYPDKNNTANAYYSYSKGTYEMDGDKMVVTYTEEMCDPVGSETLIVRQTESAITVEKDGTNIRFASDKSYSPRYVTDNYAVMVKDKNCIY